MSTHTHTNVEKRNSKSKWKKCHSSEASAATAVHTKLKKNAVLFSPRKPGERRVCLPSAYERYTHAHTHTRPINRVSRAVRTVKINARARINTHAHAPAKHKSGPVQRQLTVANVFGTQSSSIETSAVCALLGFSKTDKPPDSGCQRITRLCKSMMCIRARATHLASQRRSKTPTYTRTQAANRPLIHSSRPPENERTKTTERQQQRNANPKTISRKTCAMSIKM